MLAAWSAWLTGCAPDAARAVGASVEPVIYDVDDRRDYYELPGDPLAAQGRASVVALVRDSRLALNGGTYEIVGEPSIDEAYDLCPDERFAGQPSIAFCSGTLIDDDLVLTAGHCLLPVGPLGPGNPHCGTTRFVFDVLETADGVLAPLGVDDVYSCRAVVAHHLDDQLDYAVVQLDRPVTGRVPAPVSPVARLALGTPVAEIGFPNGLPMKIDAGGVVTDPGPKNGTYFVTDLDAFHGNSGSGVLDASGSVVGILVRTLAADYVYDATSRCYRASVLPSRLASEMATYVVRALEGLCDGAMFPSMRLCNRAPRCGDGFCTSGETAATCADCVGPICGDGIVEAPETEASCPYDFGATVVASSSGCGVASPTARSSTVPLATLLVALGLASVRRAKRRTRRLLLASLVLVFASAPLRAAHAQAVVETRGTRFVGALEGTIGTSTLRDPSGTFPSVDTRGIGGGIRAGVDVAFHRLFALEIATTARGFLDLGTTNLELTVAPRIRFPIGRAQELYVRLPMGAGLVLLTSDDRRPSGVFGLSLGYRRQLTRVVDLFAELGASIRFARDFDPIYGFVHDYGFHPSAPPSLVTNAFGVAIGVGLGRGAKKPPCEVETPHERTQ